MSEFGDESVVIDIEFKVKDSKSTDEYISKVKNDLAMLKRTFEENSPKGNEYLEGVKKSSLDTVANLTETVKKLSEVSSNVEQTRSSYMSLQQTVMQMGKGIKSGAGKYAQTTKEEFEAVKQQAREAKVLYQQAMADAKTFTDSLDEEIPKLGRVSGEYQSLTHMVKATGEAMPTVARAFKEVDSTISEINRREQIQLNALKEVYREWVEEIKAAGGQLSSQEGQDATSYFHQRSQEIKEAYEQERLLARAEEGDEEAVAQLVALEEKRTSEKKKQIDEEVKLKQQEIASVKQSTSQYYYRLRSIKMLGFTIKSVDKTLSGFGKKALSTSEVLLKNYLKLTNVFSLFGGHIKDTVSNLGSMNSRLREASSTSKSIKTTAAGIKNEQNGINFSLKTMISNILKYGLGIRSIYMLCRKLRTALSEGMENLATQWSEVNAQMSSVVTSLFQMKNAVAAAVQPILSVLAPALERVAEIVSDIAYKIASFIAALTGTTQYVYRAKRAQQKYVDTSKDAADSTDDQADTAEDAADAMDDEAEASEELRKELSKLDKLNVLTTDDSKDKDKKTKDKKQKDKKLKDLEDELGEGVQDMFEKVPIDAAMAEWAQKLKDLMEKLFKPLKGAWDAEGQFVMDAWKKALAAIWDLIKVIGKDFMIVWLQAKTQEIFENLLHVIGDIGLIVANLADNFKEAWLFAGNGRVILESIRDIILIISQGLRDAADYTVTWSENLNFIPLLTRIRQVLATQIEPAVQNIVNLLVWIYEKIFLEFLKHFIEVTAPKIVKMIGNISEAIGNISDRLLKALKRGHRGEQIVTHIENIVDTIADTLVDITEATKKWAKELKLYKLVESIWQFTKDCETPIKQICNLLKDIYNNVILPIAKYIIEKALPKAFDLAVKIAQIVGNIADKLDLAFKTSDNGKNILNSLKTIFERIGKLIEHVADKTLEWSQNIDFAPLVKAIADFFEKCEKPVDNICTLLENLYDNVILPMATYLIETVLPKVIGWAGDIVEIVGNIANNLNTAITNSDSFQKILDSVNKIAEKIGGTIDNIINKTKEWSKNIDFEPLLASIAGWLESMEKPLGFLCDTFNKFYTDVLLPFWQYIVEEGLPKLLSKLTEINNSIDWDKVTQKVNDFLDAFEPFLEKVWDTLIELLGDLGEALAKFVNSDEFDKIVDKIIEWMDNADPNEMADGIERLVRTFVEIKAFFAVASKIILPVLTSVMTFINAAKQFAMIDKVGKLTKAIAALGEEAGKTATVVGDGGGTGLLASLAKFGPVVAIVIAAIANLAFAYGGLDKAVERVVEMFKNFKKAIDDVKEQSELPKTLQKLKEDFNNLVSSVKDLIDVLFGEGAGDALIPTLQSLDQTLLEITGFGNLETQFKDLCTTVDGVLTSITKALNGIVLKVDGFVTKLRGQVLVIKGLLSGDEESVVKGFELMHEGAVKESEATEKSVSATFTTIGNGLDFFFRHDVPGYSLLTNLFGVDVREAFNATGQAITQDNKDISKSTEDTFGKDIPNSATDLESQFETPVIESFDNVKTEAESDSIVIRGQFDQLFKTDLPSDASNVQSQFSTPIMTEFDTLKTTAETDSAAIATAVDQSLNKDLANTATESKTGFFDVLKQAFQLLKYALIGDPIVYDIRDGIIEGFNEWITQTSTDVPLWSTTIAKEFTTLSTNITTALQDLPANVKKKFDEVKKGAEDKCKELLKTVKDKFGEIKKAADDKLKSDTLKKNGEQLIKGLNTGMKSELSKSKSTASKGCNDIKKEFRNNLKSNSLKSVGTQLINGLKAGLLSALNSALSAVTSICNKITAAARKAFAVSSPSKVFMKIGNYLIDGLIVGVEGEENELNDTFESLVPSSKLMDSFYNSFMEMMTKLTTNVTSLVNQMVNAIQSAISNLNHMLRISSLNKISNMMNNLDSMPNYSSPVASGKALPSNKEFVANVNVSVDLSKLPELMKSAFIDAIKETANLQTDDEAIIVNIDGKTIFQAVRSENAKYKKQTGVSAFA